MDKSEILNQFNDVFRDILDNEEIVLTAQTVAKDIEEWDSLSHIQLIVAIEKHFKIKFLSAEIRVWKNVGEMIESVAKKIGNSN